MGVRPERLRASRDPQPAAAGMNRLSLVVSQTVYRGANLLVYFSAPGGGATLLAEFPAHDDLAPRPGETLSVQWPVADTLLFAAEAAP